MFQWLKDWWQGENAFQRKIKNYFFSDKDYKQKYGEEAGEARTEQRQPMCYDDDALVAYLENKKRDKQEGDSEDDYMTTGIGCNMQLIAGVGVGPDYDKENDPDELPAGAPEPSDDGSHGDSGSDCDGDSGGD